MKDECDNKVVLFPARLLTGGLVLTGIMLVALAWSGVDSYRSIATVQMRDLRIQELRGAIVHLDEALTMSARMAAATGDSDWERRYRLLEPQLDAAIKEAVELTAHSDSAQATTQTDAANLKLVDMENKGFDLVRAGEAGRARTVLFSDAYAAQKKIYAEGMDKLILQLKEQLAANQGRKQRGAFLYIVAVALCIVFFLFTWLAILRRLNHWRTMQSANLDALRRAEDALRKLNDDLEKRVEDRTRSLQLEIRERKDTEAALRGSDEKFRQLAENITDAFWIRSPDMREVHYISPAFERIWGRSMESLHANPQQWAAAILPDDRERVLAVFATLTGAAPNVSMEYRIVRPDGEIRWVHVRGFQVRDAAGGLIRLTGIVTDITERKQAEEAMRESEARTQLLVKSSSIGLWDWNLVTNEVFFSAEWKSQLGYTDAELPSRYEEWENRLHPEDREPTLTLVKDYVEGRRADYKVEFRLRHKDGSWRWILTRADLIAGPTGHPVRIMGCHIDITERRQMEEQLRKLSCAVEQSPASIVITNTAGEIEYVNPKFTQVTGYGLDEVRGKNPRMLKSNETPAGEYQRMWTTITQGGEWHGEFHNRKKNGELFWEAASVSPIWDDKEQITHFLAVKEDITERKLSEAALEKAHKKLLETSRQAGMAEVAIGVLHNVGNVLNSVNVASSCLADSIKKSKAANLSKVVVLLREHEANLGAYLSNNPKGKQIPGYLAQLAEHLSAERASALKELAGLQKNIEHIKDIITMQQGFSKVSGATETLCVTDLVEDALKMNSSALARYDIAVTKEFQKVPLITVEKHKVLQILVNLVRNAQQACDEANPLEKRLTLRVTDGNDRVRIAVTDNGIGIPSENLTRIFAHGFTTKESGHGFGLHSGALAAKEMGGSLSVQSDGPGKGAEFTLELPYNSARIVPPTVTNPNGQLSQIHANEA